MTGYMSDRFNFNCHQRGKCYNDTLPNWDSLLENVFPRNITGSDIDFMVEVNGWMLFLEQKGEGVPLFKSGQGDALLMLSRVPQITVVVFRPNEAGYDLSVWDDGTKVPFIKVTHQQLRSWLHAWAMTADETPSPLVPAKPAARPRAG